MANTPLFVGTINTGSVELTDQVVSRDGGTGTPLTLFTAGTAGSLIHSIQVYPENTISANVLRVFLSFVGSTINHLIAEKTLTAVASAPADSSLTGYPINVDLPPYLLPALASQSALEIPASAVISVGLGTTSANTIRVTAFGGNY